MEHDSQPVIGQPPGIERAVGQPSSAPPAEPESGAAPSTPKRPGAGTARLLNLALIGALVLAVAGIGFAAGRLTAPAQAAFAGGNGPFAVNGNPRNGTGQLGIGGAQSGPVGIAGSGGPTIEGTIESMTDTTMTIKTADGQTMQIALDDSTTYHAQTDASADDVATGGKVLVRLNFKRGDGAASGLSASDVTVVP